MKEEDRVQSEATVVTRVSSSTPVTTSPSIVYSSHSAHTAQLAAPHHSASLPLVTNHGTRPVISSITSHTQTTAYLARSQSYQHLQSAQGQQQQQLQPSTSRHQQLQQQFIHLQQQQSTSPISSITPSSVPISQPLSVVTTVPSVPNNELIRLLLLRNKTLSGQQQTQQQQSVQQVSPPSQQHTISPHIHQQQFVSPQQLERQKQQDYLRKQLLIKTLLTSQREKQSQHQQQQHLGLHRSTSEGSFTYPSPPLRDVALVGLTGHRGSPGVISAPMTVNRAEAKQGDSRMEAYPSNSDLISPFINTCGDSTFSSDFMDASIYASSPNSLYIYEQEKMDMSSLGINTTCTTLDVGISEDFDLKTSYEVSQDISSFPLDSAPSTSRPPTYSMISSNTEGMSWSDEKIMKDNDVYIKMETPEEAALTPTLAELNMNFDLLEDINSYISGEMSQSTTTLRPGECVVTVKTEPDSGVVRDSKQTVTRDAQRPSASSHSMLISALSGPPVHQVVVKTEPNDMLSLMSAGSQENSSVVHYQKSFTPMTAVKPELIAPQRVTVSSPPQSTQAQPLSTIKEIDISDFRTLQNLLSQSRPLPARGANGSRRRTVSETQAMRKVPQATTPQRKRSVNTAGLESMDQKWEEIKEFLSMEAPHIAPDPATFPPVPPKRERKRYDSTSSVMTLTSNEDEDSDSDKDYDDDSDSDLEGGQDLGSLNPDESLINAKEKQCFWQYNVQSKGPKGTRVHFEMEEDPHVLNDFEDPVFDPTNTDNLNTIGVAVRHGGKARKGDGNDIVPSPRKLCQIGLQLRKINRQINDFVPVSEMPFNARSKSRKEKNKLASRACRLKKKAQHEANKVKLHGLEMEHRKLLMVIRQIKRLMIAKLKDRLTVEEQKHSMTEHLDSLISSNLDVMIAGNTTDYVNCVVHKVEAGDTTGGLKIKATRSYPLELQN